MTWEQIFLLIGWLGMFLFGMMVFEEAISFLFTKTLKNFLKTATDRLYKAISTWVFMTTVLQSSGVVSLITLAFVWAWVITFQNSLWVILWANIGTAITDVIIANLWIRYSISSLSFPIIGVFWLLMLIFNKHIKFKYLCRFFIGLGLLFLWLSYMKESMFAISSQIDFVQYVGLWSLVYFLVWFVSTLVMQSSTATIMLILTASHSWIVDYRMWVPLIMWAFLGTTITAVLASIWPFPIKKQVAFSHVFFNLFSVILGLLFLPFIVNFLNIYFVDTISWLSVFMIWFKLVWVLLIVPFINYFKKFLIKLFPIKETKLWLSLEQVDPNITDAALIAIKNDTTFLLKNIFAYILHVWSIDEKILLKNRATLDIILSAQKNVGQNSLNKEYAKIKMIEESLIAFGVQMKKQSIKDVEVEQIDKYYSVISAAVLAAKYMKDISHNILVFEEETSGWLAKQYNIFRTMLVDLYVVISEVIDGKESSEMLTKMLSLVQDIKAVDQEFIVSLGKEFSKDKIRKFDLSDILHVNRYVYLSSLSFVEAIKYIYLQSVEKKVFDELK